MLAHKTSNTFLQPRIHLPFCCHFFGLKLMDASAVNIPLPAGMRMFLFSSGLLSLVPVFLVLPQSSVPSDEMKDER